MTNEQNEVIDHFVNAIIKSHEIWSLKRALMSQLQANAEGDATAVDIPMDEVRSDLTQAKEDLWDILLTCTEKLNEYKRI